MTRRDENLQVNAILRETHAQLGSEVDRMGQISATMKRTSLKFHKTTASYDDYDASLGYSGRLVRELRRRVKYQDLVFYVCFYCYLGVCAYIFLKRFPLSWLFTPLIDISVGLFNSVSAGLGSLGGSEEL